jgi:hypothetical protein
LQNEVGAPSSSVSMLAEVVRPIDDEVLSAQSLHVAVPVSVSVDRRPSR